MNAIHGGSVEKQREKVRQITKKQFALTNMMHVTMELYRLPSLIGKTIRNQYACYIGKMKSIEQHTKKRMCVHNALNTYAICAACDVECATYDIYPNEKIETVSCIFRFTEPSQSLVNTKKSP